MINKSLKKFLIAASIIIITSISVYNIFKNGFLKFLECNFLGIVDIVLTFVIAVYITNGQSRISKQKENLENLIEKFQHNFINVLPNLIDSNKEKERQKILMLKRRTSNQFRMIKKYSEKLNIISKIKDIENKLDEFHNLISDHISDIENHETEINRFSETIDSFCEEIKLDLYN